MVKTYVGLRVRVECLASPSHSGAPARNKNVGNRRLHLKSHKTSDLWYMYYQTRTSHQSERSHDLAAMDEPAIFQSPQVQPSMQDLRRRLTHPGVVLPLFGELGNEAEKQCYFTPNLRLLSEDTIVNRLERLDIAEIPFVHHRTRSDFLFPGRKPIQRRDGRGRQSIRSQTQYLPKRASYSESQADTFHTLRQKKSLNVDSPSFTPTILARNNVISQQAASAAPFTPRGMNSREYLSFYMAVVVLWANG